MSQIKYSNLLDKNEEVATTTGSIHQTGDFCKVYQKIRQKKQSSNFNSGGTVNNKIYLDIQKINLEFSEGSISKSKKIIQNYQEIEENELKYELKNNKDNFCDFSEDDQDCINERGVYHIPIQHEVLFTEEIEIKTEELRRWQPKINLDRRMIEDEDD